MGTQTHLPIKGHSPQFPSHVYFVSKWLDVSRPSSTWYGGRPRPRRHCVRWEPSFPLQKWGMPPIFRPCVLWANGRPSQLLLSSCLFVECLPIVMGDEKRMEKSLEMTVCWKGILMFCVSLIKRRHQMTEMELEWPYWLTWCFMYF